MRMECWLAGTRSFRLLLSIVRGLSMPMRMECLDSVDSVGDRIVRFPLRIRRWPNWIPRRFFWISLSSEMGDSMDADLLPELSGETWVAATLLEGLTADLLPTGSDIIVASRQDATLTTVREWVQPGVIPAWSDCARLSPELRCWRLQIGNLSVDTEGRLWQRRATPLRASQLVVPSRERQDMISRFNDSLFAGIASRRSFLPGIMYCLSGTQVSVPTEGSHGTC